MLLLPSQSVFDDPSSQSIIPYIHPSIMSKAVIIKLERTTNVHQNKNQFIPGQTRRDLSCYCKEHNISSISVHLLAVQCEGRVKSKKNKQKRLLLSQICFHHVIKSYHLPISSTHNCSVYFVALQKLPLRYPLLKSSDQSMPMLLFMFIWLFWLWLMALNEGT